MDAHGGRRTAEGNDKRFPRAGPGMGAAELAARRRAESLIVGCEVAGNALIRGGLNVMHLPVPRNAVGGGFRRGNPRKKRLTRAVAGYTLRSAFQVGRGANVILRL